MMDHIQRRLSMFVVMVIAVVVGLLPGLQPGAHAADGTNRVEW